MNTQNIGGLYMYLEHHMKSGREPVFDSMRAMLKHFTELSQSPFNSSYQYQWKRGKPITWLPYTAMLTQMMSNIADDVGLPTPLCWTLYRSLNRPMISNDITHSSFNKKVPKAIMVNDRLAFSNQSNIDGFSRYLRACNVDPIKYLDKPKFTECETVDHLCRLSKRKLNDGQHYRWLHCLAKIPDEVMKVINKELMPVLVDDVKAYCDAVLALPTSQYKRFGLSKSDIASVKKLKRASRKSIELKISELHRFTGRNKTGIWHTDPIIKETSHSEKLLKNQESGVNVMTTA
ncbi:hypothetical protein AB6D11_00310 [Vibrio splendidus]